MRQIAKKTFNDRKGKYDYEYVAVLGHSVSKELGKEILKTFQKANPAQSYVLRESRQELIWEEVS